jgi:two-component system, LytTR family, sensor kinase
MIPAGRRRPPWYVWPMAAAGLSLLLAAYKYLGSLVVGLETPLLRPLVEEVTGVFTFVMLVPLIIAAARRYPLDRPGWPRRVPIHVACATGFGVVHTSLIWATRSLAFPLAGLGPAPYGPSAYGQELPQQAALYGLVVTASYLWDRHRVSAERDLRIAQLETELVRARLDALRMQLNPHFLFNALNTVSDAMYENVRAADGMLAALADLLRRTMTDAPDQETRLADELETLGLYTDLMRHRFRDRLDVRTTADPEARDALIPSLLLQPLVENAIEHGLAGATGAVLRVDIEAVRDGDRLRLRVRDNGPGTDAPDARPEDRSGIGLANTSERLRRLYGESHRFRAARPSGGGFQVEIEIPYRAMSGRPPAPAPVVGPP